MISLAIESCIQDGILADFLINHRAEVCDMCITEYNEKTFINGIRAEGVEEGKRELIKTMLKNGANVDELSRLVEEPVEVIKNIQKELLQPV